MYLIVGLGNPGEEYAKTRHNLGFQVIDQLAARWEIGQFKTKFSSLIAETRVARHKVIFAKPQTFMNNSGQAVQALLAWYKLGPEKLIVIYDDVDLVLAQLRLRESGSSGGHRGVQSIIEAIGSPLFPRVRLGIGKNQPSQETADYVLAKIPPAEAKVLAEAVLTATEAVELAVRDGFKSAMNKFNVLE
ncbi:aminoacyl-tRNA hydrolase [Candidatus Saganbacteria bacterium CG08_land_8_20_14_0_20_45_16]|uniref:Peptidyl-tRNA hydrolase n=1 Tax=Candidatus Saganbacteria bacterium CG08_land_8_20_14_0_20_45_16 TaxID=2014293 RepID=A0A2H0XUU7_UNCSA|nr:MAG: aminoacyl-tRNA hydrolase [Candidatus Saganbacteria bacterium CG08_land_8_20_14_0_20_45_16]